MAPTHGGYCCCHQCESPSIFRGMRAVDNGVSYDYIPIEEAELGERVGDLIKQPDGNYIRAVRVR